MKRISIKDLEYALADINERAGYGRAPIYGTEGAYSFSQAYGGIKLVQCTGRGQRDISCDGYGTKRQLYTFMRGMLATMERKA